MISILIPIYQYNVRPLVQELHQQATQFSIPFEILLMDDCSSSEFQQLNQNLSGMTNVRYEELSQKIGRSKIRNLLATKAKYDNLIFLDCDGLPTSNQYLNNYMKCLNHDVDCGGRVYQTQPNNAAFQLHWKYGNKREVKSAVDRSIIPNQSFMTNNFMIKKEILTQIPFNESISKYGHEDTLFGYDLSEHNIFHTSH